MTRRTLRPTIYTLGYGNRDIADFLSLLRRYKVKTLADIRTTPLSRFRPAFSKNALAADPIMHSEAQRQPRRRGVVP